MPISVRMPALGESVTEGTVTRWLKQEGDNVAVDEPLLEVSTDKVDTEVPSPTAGVLQRIVASEDNTVAVGGELAIIGEAGDDPRRGSAPGPAADAVPAPQDEPDAAPPLSETSAPEAVPVAESRHPPPDFRPQPRRPVGPSPAPL